MTYKLFYDSAYIREFDAEVVSCTQTENGFLVELNQTAFYPEGGGQPADTGNINDSYVTDTQEKNGIIYHLCSAPFDIGEKVHGKIDFEKRFLNMQLHSGEHILSGFINQLTGFDNVGFHMGETAVTIDFNGVVTPEILAKAQRLANETIWKNEEIEVLYPTAEELGNYNYRSKKDIQGQVRLVRIEGADLCACCGTHVSHTGEIGMVKAVSMQNYKGGVRITLHAGSRALDDYDMINRCIHESGALLAAKPYEVPQGIERLLSRCDEYKARITDLKIKYNTLRCQSIEKGTPYHLELTEGDSPDEVCKLCDIICDRADIAAVFSVCSDGTKYCIGSRTHDVRELGKAINESLNGRGGGRPEMVRGSVSANADEIKAVWKKLTAD